MGTRNHRTTEVMDDEVDGAMAVQALLDEFAEAITSGDGDTVAELWAVPALVISDDDVKPISRLAEVGAFFSGAKEQYNAKGITDTRAEILELTWPTENVAIVEVRWPHLDKKGKEIGEESSTYVLRRDPEGAFKVQAVIMQGASEGDT